MITSIFLDTSFSGEGFTLKSPKKEEIPKRILNQLEIL